AEIGAAVVEQLGADGRLALPAYRAWLTACGGYGMVTLADDSRWVLRLGDEERHVHVHPRRWVPQTGRLPAHVLKTAGPGLAHARLHGGDPKDRICVNDVRRRWLGLAPVGRDLSGDHGLGAIIDLLAT